MLLASTGPWAKPAPPNTPVLFNSSSSLSDVLHDLALSDELSTSLSFFPLLSTLGPVRA